MYYAFRITKGADLKQELTKFVKDNNISGVVLSGVGCLEKLAIRLAGAQSTLETVGNFEIVSLMGTLSTDGVHLHISVSDTTGKTFGGHLLDGNIIDTTGEIVLVDIPNYKFTREFDENTGYKELVIKKNNG